MFRKDLPYYIITDIDKRPGIGLKGELPHVSIAECHVATSTFGTTTTTAKRA